MPRVPIDYSKTVMYKLVCNDLTIKDCYIGHTINFVRRKSGHHSACTNPNAKQYHYKVYQFIRDHGGWDNWSMIQIEPFPCKDVNEAFARERYWVEKLATLNQKIPGRTKKESSFKYRKEHQNEINEQNAKYYATHRERINERQSKYDADHKEQINARKAKYHAIIITCSCGAQITQGGKSKHLKTKKHNK